MGWRITAGIAASTLVLGAVGAWRLTRDTQPTPAPVVVPSLDTRADDPSQAAFAALTLTLKAALDQNAEVLRLMQRRQDSQGVVIRDDGQAAAMAGLLRELINDGRRERGEAEIPATATPEEIAKAFTGQGGKVLPERLVQAPCKTQGRMHGLVPADGADWRLISEWDPCPPDTPKRPWLNADDWTVGTRWYGKLGGSVWGDANLTLADQLSNARLELNSTRAGWHAGAGVEHLFVSPSGRFIHGLELEATYRDSPHAGGWSAEASFKPGWFRPRRQQ